MSEKQSFFEIFENDEWLIDESENKSIEKKSDTNIINMDSLESFKKISPIYNGETILFSWSENDTTGMSINLILLDEDDDGKHPFKGLAFGKTQGQRFKVSVTQNSNNEPIYVNDALLLYWAENCKNGMSVKMLLDDVNSNIYSHPFKHLPAGKLEGERLNLVCWAINDDESAIDSDTVKIKQPFHTMSAFKQSTIICNNEYFRKWLGLNARKLLNEEQFSLLPDYEPGKLPSKEFSEIFVRTYCGIPTRKMLKSETEEGKRASSKWHQLYNMFTNNKWTIY